MDINFLDGHEDWLEIESTLHRGCASYIMDRSKRNKSAKSRLAKAAGAEVAGQMRQEKLHAGMAPSTF